MPHTLNFIINIHTRIYIYIYVYIYVALHAYSIVKQALYIYAFLTRN